MSVTVDVFVGELGAPASARPDVEQFSALYSATRTQLVRHCRWLLRGQGDPEVAAQEAFLKAWRAFDRYEQARPFWPWLSTIARQVCYDQLRHEAVVRSHAETADARIASMLDPEEEYELAEEGRLAMVALARITPQQQRLVGLRDIEGWSYEHIAEFEGISIEAVRGKLRRARQRLRVRFEELLEGAPALVPGFFGARLAVRRRFHAVVDRMRVIGQTTVTAAPALGHVGDAAVAILVVVVLGGSPISSSFESSPASTSANQTSATAVSGQALGAPDSAVDANVGSNAATRSRGANDPSAPPLSDPNRILVPGLPTQPPVSSARPPSDNGDQPENVTFHSLVPSESASAPGVVFASGTVGTGCGYPPCVALFRSQDSGRTWTRLPAIGYTGGNVLLPPSYPTDPRIFVSGQNALLVSDDDGETFRPLTSIGGPATMSPGFDSGDPTILIGAAPGWIYHDDSGSLEPLGLAPPPAGAQLNFAYAGADAGGQRKLLVGTIDPTYGSPNAAAVSLCTGSVCRTVAGLSGVYGTPAVAISASDPRGATVFAWRGHALYRSLDGGDSFAPLELPLQGDVQSLADDGAGTLYLGLGTISAGASTGALFASHDNGSTWTRLGAGTLIDTGINDVVALGSGELLAALASPNAGGLLRSIDDGHSWQAVESAVTTEGT